MDRKTYLYLRQEKIKDRILDEAHWIIDNRCSIRSCSREMLLSKSQVHRDMQALKHIDDYLYVQVKNIFKEHRKG